MRLVPLGHMIPTTTTHTSTTSASAIVATVITPAMGPRCGCGCAAQGDGPEAEQDRGLTSRLGPVEIDWPMTIGYYGGIALAIALEAIEPPLALVIAAIPF